ncbi:DUF4230 domain-containing protein [Halalkalibacter alkaliphilus]|uniref:DUF4230 domain-containing protein n=1 Tax=Halalkalibacter alkaliphilus TaxID=2917993 RepID=A0A9X2I6I9_9BACI|nr:DUF4230 domain-containing protein [Halalkalibacter alkaliphilus]MCL7749211.1 DUF4230 domain-containing protein [Halalkalibacter alkaliphilus]
MSDEKSKQVKEIEKAKAEVASAIAVNTPKQSSPFFSPKRMLAGIWRGKVALLLTMIAALLAAIIISSTSLFSGSTFQEDNAAIVDSVRDLATLATAEAHITAVLEQENNELFGKEIGFNLPGTQRKLLLIVPATVVAGVDLTQVNTMNIHIDQETGMIEMSLPRASFVQEPSIIMEQIQTFSSEGVLRGAVTWDEGFELAADAQELIKEEAVAIGLLATAEKNAGKVLSEFFANLGYEIDVSFQ